MLFQSCDVRQNSPVKKMSRTDFAKFLRGLNDGKDFSLLLIRARYATSHTTHLTSVQDVYESVARQELPYFQGLTPPTEALRPRASPGTARKLVSLVRCKHCRYVSDVWSAEGCQSRCIQAALV